MTQDERKFILNHFHLEWKVNIYCLNEVGNLVETYSKENPAWKELLENPDREEMSVELLQFFDEICSLCREKQTPLLLPEKDGIYHMVFSDTDNNIYLLGPASARDISFAQILEYRKNHYVTNQKFQIPTLSIGKALNGLILLYYMLTGRQVSVEEILGDRNALVEKYADIHVNEKDILVYEIQQTTEEKRRLAYKDELKWLAEIETGTRMDTTKRMSSEDLEKLERIGTFSNKNALKQFEYMVIASTTLACRAAIRGGVNAYDAYHLADVFFQKASMCTDIMQLLQLYAEVADGFSRQVRKAKENPSTDLVEQCKEYIARHRTKKFSLAALAKEVGKNPSYLSRIFSEQTGRTLQEYALEQRLEAGANLLKYSDRSVGEIADYLNFSSQSYFGEYFKKQYRQTPVDFRKTYKIKDFKE